MRRLSTALIASAAFLAPTVTVPVQAADSSLNITSIKLVDSTTVVLTGTIACPVEWNPYVELELTQRAGREPVTAYGGWVSRDCYPEGQTFTTELEVFEGSLHPGRATLWVNAYGWQFAPEGGLDFFDIANYYTRVILRPR